MRSMIAPLFQRTAWAPDGGVVSVEEPTIRPASLSADALLADPPSVPRSVLMPFCLGSAAQKDGIGLGHVAQVGLRQLFVGHDPVELSALGGEVAVGADVIERDDSSQVASPGKVIKNCKGPRTSTIANLTF